MNNKFHPLFLKTEERINMFKAVVPVDYERWTCGASGVAGERWKLVGFENILRKHPAISQHVFESEG